MAKSYYPPDVLIHEAASLFHLLGKMATHHLAIVGGLVPPLLAPTAAQAHSGSGDIDFCLSVAITSGATREYYKSIEALLEPYFAPLDGNEFRWQKKDGAPGIPLVIDFLGPESDEDTTEVLGTRTLSDETAAANTGTHLRPFAIKAGSLVDRDAVTQTMVGVPLVYWPGVKADVLIRHAGPVGFLAAKAEALNNRYEPKDGYDVSWWCLNAAASPAEVAQLVMQRPAFKDELFPESVALLRSAFKARDYHGPSGYAAVAHPQAGPGDEIYEQARNRAYLTVSRLINELHENLW